MKNTAEQKRLRLFGLTVSTIIAGGIYLFSTRADALFYLSVFIMAVFLICACFSPTKLSRIESLWLKFGEFISTIMSYILVTLLFFLVITPLALIMRICGKQPLTLKFRAPSPSHWSPSDNASRPFLPY